jgi:hypothetical protein
LVGRWRSDEMLRYLHVQAEPTMRGFSARMLQHPLLLNSHPQSSRPCPMFHVPCWQRFPPNPRWSPI